MSTKEKYVGMNTDEMEKKLLNIIEIWEEYLDKSLPVYKKQCDLRKKKYIVPSEYSAKDLYDVNLLVLRETFDRTNQRADYFLRYHDLIMSNYKEIGLIAYWLIKLKPFNLKSEMFDDYINLRINEEFALYFIFKMSSNYIKLDGGKYDMNKISSELYNELLYSFLYRDIPKEAMGCLVELIATAIRVI